jgi:hypothetical protein
MVTPYAVMSDGVYGKDTSIHKATCPTAKDLNSLRPNHYGGANNPYEVFNVLEAWELDKDFYLANVIKYLARAGKKDSTKYKEDLEKALVYLQRRINTL